MKMFTIDLYLVTNLDRNNDDMIVHGSRLRIHVRGTKRIAAFRPIHDFLETKFMNWTESCFMEYKKLDMSEFDKEYNFERFLMGSEKIKASNAKAALNRIMFELNNGRNCF